MACWRTGRRLPAPFGSILQRVLTRRRRGVIAASLALLLGTGAATAAVGEVSTADLQATANAMGFLDGLPHDGTLAVGIVYSGAPDGNAAAQQAADRLRGIAGPKAARFEPVLIAADRLNEAPDRLDALFLMPGVSGSAAAIIEMARRRHLVIISADTACLDAKCCVLMVHTDRRVQIVLDTALADAVGVRFPTVFLMVVERR
jgi:hypothetical protein